MVNPRSLEHVLSELSFSKTDNLMLTPDQIHEMASLAYENGTPFFKYEIRDGIVNQEDSEFLYSFITMRIFNNKTPDEIVDEIKKIIKYYKNPVSYRTLLFKTGEYFYNEDAALKADLKRIKNGFSVSEPGFVKCTNCGSDRTVSISVQTRSGDEGTDTFNECMKCGNKWRIRG